MVLVFLATSDASFSAQLVMTMFSPVAGPTGLKHLFLYFFVHQI